MITALDATPLLGARTGIGRYVEHLLAALTARADAPDLVATCFSLRGRAALAAAVPAGVRAKTRPVPANLLQRSWMNGDVPSMELASGIRADVFHGTNFVLPPLRRATGVLTVHDLTYLRNPELVDVTTRRLRVLVPRGLARAAIVVTPSQATADDISQAYGLPADRLLVTPLGVDPAWACARPPTEPERAALGLPADYLVAVGTLEPRKGLDVLLDALRLLHAEGVAVPALVLVGAVGWGPGLDRTGLPAGSVVETGWLDQERLRSVVAGARCLAFPSRYEGFGLPPLEALAAGVPVVASDLAVCKEVLGEHARYAGVGDATALAQALATTLRDGGPTSVATARAHATSYTWERCAEATVTAYRRASD